MHGLVQLIAKILHTEEKSRSCLHQLVHTSAYSEDLRWRMIWQSVLLAYSQQPIAQNLGVDQSTVSRTIQLFETTGSVGKKPNPKERSFRKLTAPCQLLHLVLQRPGIHYICTMVKLLSHDRTDVRNFHFLPQYARSWQSTVRGRSRFESGCRQIFWKRP